MNDGAARAEDHRRAPVSRRNLLSFAIGAAFGLGGASCAEITNGARGFRVPTLDGEVFDASEHIGKHALLITFWSSSCEPCLRQMPIFSELHRAYAARGLVVIAISIDGPSLSAQVRARAADAGIDFPVLLDEDSTVFNRYAPHHDFPLTLVVNRDGSVRRRFAGVVFTGTSQGLAPLIESALDVPAAATGE